MLASLQNLKKDAPREEWGNVLLDLADLLIRSNDTLSDHDLNVFSEIVMLVYGRSGASDRLRLSHKLARCASTPVPLALHLAHEPIIIAQPVLEHCPVFGEDDLADMARSLDDDHLQFLARRKDLGIPVSDILVRQGQQTVRRLLAGNRQIHLSPMALRVLVRHSMSDAVLREDLTLRSDLTPTICRQLLPHVSAPARKRLQEIISGALTQEERDTLARLRELRRKFGTKLDLADVKMLWSFAEREAIFQDDLFCLLLQDNRLSTASDLLAYLTRISPEEMRNAIYRGNVSLVVDAANALALKPLTFATLARSRCTSLRIPMSQADSWIQAYADILEKKTFRMPRRGDGSFSARRPLKPKRRRTMTRRTATL